MPAPTARTRTVAAVATSILTACAVIAGGVVLLDNSGASPNGETASSASSESSTSTTAAVTTVTTVPGVGDVGTGATSAPDGTTTSDPNATVPASPDPNGGAAPVWPPVVPDLGSEPEPSAPDQPVDPPTFDPPPPPGSVPTSPPLPVPGSLIQTEDVPYVQGYTTRQWKYRLADPSISNADLCALLVANITAQGYTNIRNFCSESDVDIMFDAPGWSGIVTREFTNWVIVEARAR